MSGYLAKKGERRENGEIGLHQTRLTVLCRPPSTTEASSRPPLAGQLTKLPVAMADGFCWLVGLLACWIPGIPPHPWSEEAGAAAAYPPPSKFRARAKRTQDARGTHARRKSRMHRKTPMTPNQVVSLVSLWPQLARRLSWRNIGACHPFASAFAFCTRPLQYQCPLGVGAVPSIFVFPKRRLHFQSRQRQGMAW